MRYQLGSKLPGTRPKVVVGLFIARPVHARDAEGKMICAPAGAEMRSKVHVDEVVGSTSLYFLNPADDPTGGSQTVTDELRESVARQLAAAQSRDYEAAQALVASLRARRVALDRQLEQAEGALAAVAALRDKK